jgi:hypothetical protein
MLTTKALAQLDSQSMNNVNLNNFDSKSIISDADSADTFRSWASNWSDCTNATFNKVHRYWRSNSALHKEVIKCSINCLVFEFQVNLCLIKSKRSWLC